MYFACVRVSRRTAQERCTKCGSCGERSGCMPTSSGSRLPLRVLQLEQAVRTLVHAFVPPQLLLRAAAELAAVVVAGKQERVGDLAAEAAGDVDEANESDDGRAWHRHP